MNSSGIKNNMLYYQQDLRTPVSKLTLVFQGAGEQKENETTIGLGAITAKLLFHGTTKYTRDELQNEFDLLGATVSAFVNESDFVIRIVCFSRTLSRVVNLISHCIEECTFPQPEIELVKRQESNRLTSLLQSNDELLRIANRYVLFHGSHLGKTGSWSSIERIKQDDIREYFKNVRSSANAYCTALTDLSEAEIRKYLSNIFDNRPRNGFILDAEPEYRQSERMEAFIVDIPDAPNDRLLWTHQGLRANDSRRYALSIILDALGSFEGYLFDELRNKKGWCYGMYAFQYPPSARMGRIGYYSDPSKDTSQYLIPKLLDLLHTFGSNDDYLLRRIERTESFKNRYAYQQDLNYKITSQIQRDKYGIPILSRDEYYSEIDAVNNSLVDDVIRTVFVVENLTMTFCGNKDRISSIIASINPAISIRILSKTELLS